MVLEPALTGGLKGVPEKRELTWIEFEHNDTLFGSVSIRSHYIPGVRDPKGCVRPVVEFETKSAGIDALAEAVLIDDQNQVEGELIEKAFIHDFIRSFDSGWTAEQVRISSTYLAS